MNNEEAQREQHKSQGTWGEWADNRVGEEGARALGKVLKTNTTLAMLNLGGEQQGLKEAQREHKTSTLLGL